MVAKSLYSPPTDQSRVGVTDTNVIAGLVVANHCYLDTIEFLLNRPLDRTEVDELEAAFGRRPRLLRSKHRRGKWRLLIQRPNVAGLGCAAEIVPLHKVRRIEWAVDLETSSAEDAHRIAMFLRQHLYQRYHGKRRCNVYESTLYAARDHWTARNMAVYSDRPSKISGRPCCHVELRYRGIAACRRIGGEKVRGLLRINPLRLFKREIALAYVDRAKFERAIRREVRRLRRGNIDARHHREIERWLYLLLCHGTQTETWLPTSDDVHRAAVQDVKELGWVFLRPAFLAIANDMFLPERQRRTECPD